MMSSDYLHFSDWGISGGGSCCPILIAGPCSAESEDQLRQVAMRLRDTGITFFRAGAWKPRTRPGAFEGAGEDALKWLGRIREEFGYRCMVEVANAKHVGLALAHKMDAVWIGSRTTVTPFAVQEIADALSGVDIPVFVKNPIHLDLELWIGAIERLRGAGIRRIGAVLRGCGGVAPGKYRNAPCWQLAIDLKQRLPVVPCLCDPSHIAGNTEYILELSQQAINLDFQGLMLEVHPNPNQALSDAKQQLTPEQCNTIIKSLKPRSTEGGDHNYQLKLDQLRLEIDQLDVTLITTLARRMKVSREIGNLKRDNHIIVLQASRWERVLAQVIAKGKKVGLDEEFVAEIYNRIHLESIRQQQ